MAESATTFRWYEKFFSEGQAEARFMHAVTAVDTSAGGTTQTTNCTLVPGNSLLWNVSVFTFELMDGDATQTLEVGISGNIDKYCDTADYVETTISTFTSSLNGTTNDQKQIEYLAVDTQLIATWTNTASATAGKFLVVATWLAIG